MLHSGDIRRENSDCRSFGNFGSLKRRLIFVDKPCVVDYANVMPIISPEHFKEIMRQWVAGVTVVTSCLGEDIRGVTANSFTSVSLTPPLVLVTLAKRLHTYRMIQQSRIFAINILSEHQQEVSERFAGKVPELDDRFQDEPHHVEVTGAPVLDRAIAFMDCRVVAVHDVGFNVIFIAQVEAGRVQNLDAPLIYSNRRYWKLSAESSGSDHHKSR